MNIKAELVREHSKAVKMKIVNYVGADIKRFNQLYELFKAEDYRVSQRAAWSLSYCVQDNPQFLEGRYGELLELLEQPRHTAIKRNIVRMLQFVEIPEEWQGLYYKRCMQYVASVKEAVAVRCFSMEVLCNMALGTPELEEELVWVLSDFAHAASPALRARSRNLLKKLQRKK